MPKTKEDRVKEGVTLLKKIRDLPSNFGLYGNDRGFLEIKAAISEWVEKGKAADLKIPLYRQERMAELVLPMSDKVASLALKVLPFHIPNDLD